MEKFADIHIHLLCGVDDGAQDMAETEAILDAAYADGTRVICATPHFHPGYFGENAAAAQEAFTNLKKCAKKYKDLQLCFGNELRYGPSCLEWLKSGACRSLNGSRYVLTDFLENDAGDYIVESLLRLLNAGYTPVLAHAERYEGFRRDLREIRYLRDCGVVIQVDAQSPFGGWGRGSKQRSRKILDERLADLVGSDGHNTADRPPQLSGCYAYVAEKCGRDYAGRLFRENPLRIVNDEDIRKDTDG